MFSVLSADRWIGTNGIEEVLQIHDNGGLLGAMFCRGPQCGILPQVGGDGRSLALYDLGKPTDQLLGIEA